MDRMGFPFTPEVAFLYNASTAIQMGQAVTWAGTATNMQYPEPDLSGGLKPQLVNQSARTTSVVMAVPAIKKASSPTDHNGLCGVALETIAATSWGHVALSGVVDVFIGGSANIAVNDPLYVSAGNFAEVAVPATATAIHAMALEATITSGTCASALISAWIPRSMAGQDLTCGLSTA